MNTTDRFGYLLQLYLDNQLSPEEHEEFLALLATGRYDDRLSKELQRDFQNPAFQQTDLPPHLAQEIIRNIYGAEKSTTKVLPIARNKNRRLVWMAAASVLIICLSSIFYFNQDHNPSASHNQSISQVPEGMVVRQNSGKTALTVILEDSSSVSLEPGSSLHYPKQFDKAAREVYIKGEAFFNVQKNPAKPFLVYASNIVTKVLGTSFTVRTQMETGNVEVLVRSGKVQVYENEQLVKEGKPGSVVVTPNQKAIYASAQRLLQTALVDKPQLVPEEGSPETTNNLVYEYEPLKNVFASLEKAYGIEIVTENSNINGCVFTGDVSGQDLFTQLKIICLATNATYEVNQTRILIKGPGCPK